MNQKQIFNSLAKNAFDFLKQAIEEFDRSPKYSVIHFCAAVEMILKARLMVEHWSLIVSKPEQANIDKFISGSFISVTMEESRLRLRDIAKEEIPDDAFNSFRELANHRNKMIHFFHSGIDKNEQAKAKIVAEHCRAWFYLHQLLEKWDAYFKGFRGEVSKANRAMKSHSKYLSAKFKVLKPELDAARNAGNVPQKCNACNFKAAIPDHLDQQITNLTCIVCDHIETQVEIECPHCSQQVVVASEGFATCWNCGGKIEPEHVVYALTDGAAHIAIADGENGWENANCANCDGYHTVVNRSNFYFCGNCFDISDHVEYCGWCNEPNTGDMEHSYGSGCNHCDGRMGWEKDD